MIKGYDPVAYFTQNKAMQGTPEYSAIDGLEPTGNSPVRKIAIFLSPSQPNMPLNMGGIALMVSHLEPLPQTLTPKLGASSKANFISVTIRERLTGLKKYQPNLLT